METLEPILSEHAFFRDLPPAHLKIIVGCASNVKFEPGEFLFREGGDADRFYLIRHGRVALQIFTTHKGPVTVQTISPGDVVGWSWLIAPYHWHFDAQAMEPTRAIALDGKCLRGKCEDDHNLGYELMKRFAHIMEERLQATRLQLLDLYGTHG
jgi:CRP/FNR family cyclic AMP-dependent transcriptional regulator